MRVVIASIWDGYSLPADVVTCYYPPRQLLRVVAVFAPCSERSNSVATKYYYSGGVCVALKIRVLETATVRVGATLNCLFSDHLGSTSITADSSGNLVGGMMYTAFGETRYTAGTTPTSYRYTGQRQAEAGLYFYVARFYNPALGRFNQADTMVPKPGSPIAWDRYAYSNNNPIRYIDPSGHKALDEEENPPPPSLPSPTPQPTPPTPISPSSSSLPPNAIWTNPGPNTLLDSSDNNIIVGYKVIIHWDRVDWLDVTLSGIGILGDISLASTVLGDVIGPGIWGASELGEFAGAVSHIKAGYDYFTKSDIRGIVLEGGKGIVKILSLPPGFGVAFNVVSIGIDVGETVELVPIVQKKEDPIRYPPFPLYPTPSK